MTNNNELTVKSIDKIIEKANMSLEDSIGHLKTKDGINKVVDKYLEKYYEVDEFKDIKTLAEYRAFMYDSIEMFIDYALSRNNENLEALSSDDLNELINKIYIRFADILDGKEKWKVSITHTSIAHLMI